MRSQQFRYRNKTPSSPSSYAHSTEVFHEPELRPPDHGLTLGSTVLLADSASRASARLNCLAGIAAISLADTLERVS